MAEIIRMPKLSDTMTEGVVAEWHKNIGDEVESGELLAEIETDKATMEFESFQDGVLLHIGVEKGGTAPVDSVLCVLGEKGEDIADLLASAEAEAPAEEAPALHRHLPQHPLRRLPQLQHLHPLLQRPLPQQRKRLLLQLPLWRTARESVSLGQAFGRGARTELGLDSRFG